MMRCTVYLAVLKTLSIYVSSQVCNISDNERFDCFPESFANEKDCIKRGCCWRPASNKPHLNVPYCYYGNGNYGYEVRYEQETATGFMLKLSLKGPGGAYGKNINNLVADFKFETASRLRVKIYDADNKRYEVPVPTPDVTSKEQNPTYDVTYSNFPFGFAVTRKSTNSVIFDTRVGGFTFSDQFLQISSLLPSEHIYGLGEHVMGLKLDTKWTKLSLYSIDGVTKEKLLPTGGVNLYGVHPFYLNMENYGNANAVFLKNSNAMDIILQPTPAITYRPIGGILDFYIFLGPSPNEAIQQYTEVIGKPTMPPYWSLGFHLSRWGYGTIENMEMIRSFMVANKIPQDVQWNDIDYMDNYKDFTINHNKFHGLSSFVDNLHEGGMHYVPIIDPSVRLTKQGYTPNDEEQNPKQGYTPYDEGLQKNVFIKDEQGDVLIGEAWPKYGHSHGMAAFPDFFHPNASEYWYNQIKTFHDQLKIDGLWIDMNEPTNFCQGSTKGCSSNRYDHPPYLPGILGGYLAHKTVCMSAKHAIGIHYDLHSLYGHSQAVATMSALKRVRNKRSFVLTRSSFSGTGHHAAHWLGDNNSRWEDLYISIAGILLFNMFGIPMIGADICGFFGDTTEELCSRWIQLGAFYPFSRNHNAIGQKDQDPAAFGSQHILLVQQVLDTRYTLLPYLYSLMHEAHVEGSTVARPLFFEFPNDIATYGIDCQFMWGSGLLISPVVTQGVASIQAYLPKGRWYEYYTGGIIDSTGETVTLPASFEHTNLHLRGGTIIPIQKPALTTTESRKNSYNLIVALDEENNANGFLYMDDGDSLLDEGFANTSLVEFHCTEKTLKTHALRTGYVPHNKDLTSIIIYGVTTKPSGAFLNGNKQRFTYNATHKTMHIILSKASILVDNTITWSSYFKRRNFREKKISRFRGFLPFLRKYNSNLDERQ